MEVQSVTDRSATITWTRPEGSNISYQIFLSNELIEDNFGHTAYTFNGLSGETSYNGKITATDGSQSTTANFSFETQAYVPPVFKGGVFLGNQQQVNEFGSHHYNEITQNLRINGFEVFDLTPLKDLKKVGGVVEIEHTTIQTVDGLKNLEFIGDFLRLYNNKEILDINSLQKLTHIGGDLLFFSNTKLEVINGLKNVSGFTGAFQVEGSKIKHVNILNDAKRLKNLYFGFNPELLIIEGLDNVTVIDEFWIMILTKS